MLLGQKKKCHVWNRQLLQLSWGLSFPRSSSPAHTYPAGDQGDYKIRRKWVISRLKTPKLIHKHLVHEELTRLFNYTWCGGTSLPLSPAHLFHIGMGTAAPCCAPRPQHLEAQPQDSVPSWGKGWGALQKARGALQMAQGALQITHFLFLVPGALT